MAISVVQSWSTTPTVDLNTQAGASGASVTAGNRVVVAVAINASFNAADIGTTGVTDNLGTTYTRDIISTPHGGGASFVCTAIFSGVPASSGTLTVTVDGVNAGDGLWFGAVELAGAASSAFDKSVGVFVSGNASPPATGNLGGTTSQADEFELVILSVYDPSGGAITVDVVSPAYTSFANSTAHAAGSTSEQPPGDMSYRILTSTTNVGATWTAPAFGGLYYYATCAATYKGAAAAGGSLLAPRRRHPNARGLITHPRRFR